MSESHDVAQLVGLVLPSVLGVIFKKWSGLSEEGRLLVTVLTCGVVGTLLIVLMGKDVTVESVSTSVLWVWGVSQLSFKSGQVVMKRMGG